MLVPPPSEAIRLLRETIWEKHKQGLDMRKCVALLAAIEKEFAEPQWLEPEPEGIRRIKLTQGKWAIVDAQDYAVLSAYKWFAQLSPHGIWYAVQAQGKALMHREVMNAPRGIKVDHKDRNGLNNTRQNLRLCTSSQNMANRKITAGRRFKGVWRASSKSVRFVASIYFQGIKRHIGCYATEEEAARAYDTKALELFGEFARPNFPTANR